MNNRRSIKSMLVKPALAAAVAVLIPVVGTPPARAVAVTPGDALSAAKAAFDAYNKYFGGEMTLSSATTKIIDAVNAARDDIISHIDSLAASDGRACAQSAVIKLDNIVNMSADQKQQFADENTDCVGDVSQGIVGATDKPAINDLGLSLNAIGPITLLSYTYADWASTTALRAALRASNNRVISKLEPHCWPSYLTGDQPPGQPVEVLLTCQSYHEPPDTQRGYSFTFSNRVFDYTAAKAVAMAGTAYNLARSVLPGLA